MDLHAAEQASVNANLARPIHWYDVPEKLAKQTGVRKVGLIELSSEEELMATRRSGKDAIQLSFELAKECVRRVNDDPVNTGNGSSQAFWAKSTSGSSKLRQLIMTAYADIHNAKDDDAESFLNSRTTTVG